MMAIDIRQILNACQKLRSRPWVDWPLSLKVFLLFFASVLLFLIVNAIFFADTTHGVMRNIQTIHSLQSQLAQQQTIIKQVMATNNTAETALLNFTDVINHIERLTKQHPVKIISIKPPIKPAANSAEGESLQLVLSGNYENLTALMKAVAKFPMNISLQGFVLEKGQSPASPGELQLMIDFYFYKVGDA